MVRREEVDLEFASSVLQELVDAHDRVDYSEPLQAVLVLLERQHADMFSRQSDADGNSWPPLSAPTMAKTRRDTILAGDRRLRDSLTSSSGDAVREQDSESLLFGTSVPYSFYHQSGTRVLPQRRHVGIRDETVDQLAELVADHEVDELKV